MTPLTPLDEFREALGYNPFHFWGLASDSAVPVTSSCNDVLKQHSWQSADRASRGDVVRAMENAERLLRGYLGYDVAPAYSQEDIKWPRYFDNSRHRFLSMDATGRHIAITYPRGHVQALGVETLTLVGTASKSDPPVGGDSLVFTDRDGDQVYDTFTITLATTETDANRLAVYFVTADRLDSDPVGEPWRIGPVSASISGGTATIRGRLWLLVRPVLYEGVSTANLDPALLGATGPYAQSLAVYSRTTNPNGNTRTTSQATLIWETDPCHGWWCCCNSCSAATYDPVDSSADPAAVAYAVARAGIRDSDMGVVTVGQALLDAASGLWTQTPWDICHEPDKAQIRALAGFPLVNQRVDSYYRTIVVRLAMADLGKRIEACGAALHELHNWQFDLARSSGSNDEVFGYISREDLSNPLGTRRGHVYAWKQIRNVQNLPGFSV